MIKLSVVVLSFNTREFTKKCLDSLVHNAKSMAENEIIVVDNSSTDGSVEMIRKYIADNPSLKIRLIENGENLGFARGNNIGIKSALGEHIMILNSDTIVQENSLFELIKESSKGRVAASPILLLPDGRFQNDYYMRFPNLWQIFLYHNPLLRPLATKVPFLGRLIVQGSKTSPFEVDQLPGAAIAAHRDVWKEVGLLDDEYSFFFEDVDWCWRAKEKGIRLMVVPKSKIKHAGGASWREKKKKNKSGFYYQFFSSMLLFARKNYSKKRSFIFKYAIIMNFIFTFKPFLAWEFYKLDGRPKNFLR